MKIRKKKQSETTPEIYAKKNSFTHIFSYKWEIKLLPFRESFFGCISVDSCQIFLKEKKSFENIQIFILAFKSRQIFREKI